MLAANNIQPILEPIHYLEEKPLKIVEKFRKSSRRKISNKEGIRKKASSKTRKNRTCKRNAQLQRKVKMEYSLRKGDDKGDIKNTLANDPLFTPQIEVKCELNEDTFDPDAQYKEEVEIDFDTDDDKDYCMEECEEDDDDDDDEDDDDEEYEINNKKKMFSKTNFKKNKKSEMKDDDDNDDDDDDDDEDDDDNEPLILLTEKSTRKKYKKKTILRLKICGDTCKYKCSIKFNTQQRLDIFNYYSHLSEEDKVNFIREHIRKPVLKRLRSTKVRNNCCYFLDYYQIGKSLDFKKPEATQTAPEDNKSPNDDNEDLTKVCRKFFDRTLSISDKEIKEAIKDYELKSERIIRPPKEEKIEEVTKLVAKQPNEIQQPKQYLDPETGDLTDTKPKKKSRRRKRGEPLPERFPKPVNCAIRCIFKCHEKFNEVERKQICDIFWSLDFKRRKDFILSRIETTDVKTPITPEFRKTNRPTRAYQTKFYLRSGPKSENIRVCKHFILNTLCINRWFIENAIEFADKTTGAYTGTDRRGVTGGFNKISDDRKQTVLDHIESYPYWIPNKKSKTKYLHYSLNIRKMYEAYKEKCLAEKIDYVHVHYYYQVFHSHFHVLFLANPHPKKGRGYYKTNPNISHYTGEEAGGCWIDSKGNKLNLRSINPALTLDVSQNNLSSYSTSTSLVPNPCAAGSSAHPVNLGHNPISVLSLKNIVNQQSALGIVRPDLNSSYGNLPADTVNMFRML